MKRLLSIELMKIRHNRASRILIITYFTLLALISLISIIKFDLGNIELRPAEMGIFNFPYIWHFTSWFGACAKIFFAVIIVSMMANEYTYGTLKQNLIDGLSKKELIQSKFLTVGLFSLASTVFMFVLTLILGFTFSSYTELATVFTDTEYLLLYFVNHFAFFSFCMFLGILIKRSAFALGFLGMWKIAEGIAYAILANAVFKTGKTAETIYGFFPLESISNLIREPFSRLSAIRTMKDQIGMAQAPEYGMDYGNLAVVLAWTALFIFLSYKIVQKRDL